MRAASAGLIVCVALWGTVFIAAHELLPELDAFQIVTLRFMILIAVFGAVLLARSDWRPRLERHEWPLLLIAAVAAVPVSQIPIIDGQRFLSPPITALVVTLSPAIAAVLAALVHRERLSRRGAAGFAIALAGVAMIVVLGAGSGAQLEASDPLRASLAVLSPIAWAAYTLMSKPLSERHHPIGLAGMIMIVLDGAAELSAAGWAWMVFLAIGGTAVPYVLWSISLQSMPVNKTAAFMYLVPVFALLWTALFLGQPPTAVAIGGGVVVLAGVALTQVKPKVRV
jgi:drug/metabolite transporter (DMT)-like permease